MRRVPIGLLIAIAAYVALRALILHTNFESVALPMYELYPMGTMAELTLRGIDFPLRYFYDNAAGQILMGFLTVPVFAVCGSSYLALKLLPAALGLATLVLVWKLLDRHFGRRAADIAALLFAVGPPTLTKYSLINSGNHFENLAFTMLAIVLAYRWFASAAKSRAALFAYALACGVAVFVFLGALIPVGILFGLHLGLRGLRQAARDLPVLVAGFAPGVAPLVIVNAVTSARGLDFLGAKFGNDNSGRGADVLARSLDFIGWRLLEAPVFEPFAGLSGPALSGLFLAAFAIAWLASLPSVATSVSSFARGLIDPPRSSEAQLAAFEHARLVPFVIYVPLAALAYGISNFRLGGHAPPIEVAGFRYYLPTILFALILIAVWADRWIARRGTMRLAGLALVTMAALPSASSLGLVDWSFRTRAVGARLEGYNLAQIARALLSSRNAVDRAEIVARVDGLPPEIRPRVRTALGFNLGVQARQDAAKSWGAEWSLDLDSFLAPWPAEWQPWLVAGLGAGLRWHARMTNAPMDRVVESARRVSGVRPDLEMALWAGLARPGVNLPFPWETQRILAEDADLIARRGDELPQFVRATRTLCRQLVERGIASDVEHVEEIEQRLADVRAWQESAGVGEYGPRW